MIYVIYGRPKSGKTTMAIEGHPPGRTAILNADDGLVGIDTEGITVVDDLSTANLNKTVMSQAFLKKHDRIVIDTATALYEQMLYEANSGKSPTLQSRGAVNNAFATLLRTLKGDGREIIIVCQEKMVLPTSDWISEDDEEEQTASVTVDLPKGAATTLETMADVIGRLYIASVGEGYVRRLWLTPTPSIVAGARSKRYRGKPPYLPKPSISRLNKLLGWN